MVARSSLQPKHPSRGWELRERRERGRGGEERDHQVALTATDWGSTLKKVLLKVVIKKGVKSDSKMCLP